MLFKGILYANGATFLLPIRRSLRNITKSHDLKIKRELLTLYTHTREYTVANTCTHETGSLYIFILLKMYREKLLYYMVNVFDGIMGEC